MMPKLRLMVVLAGVVVTVLSLPVAARSQGAVPSPSPATRAPDDAVQVEVAQKSVELPPSGTVQVQVIVRNRMTEAVRNVTLSTHSNHGVRLAAGMPALETLAAQADHVWLVDLTQTDGPLPGSLTFAVWYTPQPADGTSRSPRVVIGTVDVKPADVEPVDQIVDVQVKTSATSLTQQRPGIVYLVIANKTAEAVTVQHVRPRGPAIVIHQDTIFGAAPGPVPSPSPTPTAFVAFTPSEISTPVTLLPGAARTVEFQVDALPEVQTGKQLLLFEIGVEAGGRTLSALATHEIAVGVVGESELLSALQIPSLLLVPGVLIVGIWVLALKWSRDRTFALSTDPKDPSFWVVVTAASLFMAFVGYPGLTLLYYGKPRDYFAFYGVTDVILVWVMSVVLAVVLAAIGFAAVWAVVEARRAYLRTVTPTENDLPIPLMRKLNGWRVFGRKLRPFLTQVTLSIDGQEHLAFLIQPVAQSAPTSWIAPGIEIVWDAAQAVSSSELQAKVEAQRTKTGDLGKIAGFLEQGQSAGYVTQVRWQTSERIRGPSQAATSELTYRAPQTFIQNAL